jgi:hypothetical protein
MSCPLPPAIELQEMCDRVFVLVHFITFFHPLQGGVDKEYHHNADSSSYGYLSQYLARACQFRVSFSHFSLDELYDFWVNLAHSHALNNPAKEDAIFAFL